MNIYVAATLFALLIFLYWVISEVFTVLFRLIGLPMDKARFQVTSLLTGCGFTTHESEMILSNRSRRRLAHITMLFGYVFNITIVSAFVNVFVSMKLSQLGAHIISMLIPISVALGVIVLSRVRAVRFWLDRQIERLAGRMTGEDAYNSITPFDQIDKDAIAQVTLKVVPPVLDGKTLLEADLKRQQNILVLLVERPGEKAIAANAETVLHPGDRVTVFGDYAHLCEVFSAKEYFSD